MTQILSKIPNPKEMNKMTGIRTTKTMKILILTFIISFSILLHSLTAAAIPVPQGISGRVYDDSSLIELQHVQFSINNTVTGQFIKGTTGYGSPGRYSASLTGNNGDLLILRAWNSEHSTTRIVNLTGVMRNVNLFLNSSVLGSSVASVQAVSGTPTTLTTSTTQTALTTQETLETQKPEILPESVSEIIVNDDALDYDTVRETAAELIPRLKAQQSQQAQRSQTTQANGGNTGSGSRSGLTKIETSVLPIPFKIFGAVYSATDRDPITNLSFEVYNHETDERISGKTGYDEFAGKFFTVVNGQFGNTVSINLAGELATIFTLDSETINVNLIYNTTSSHILITGRTVTPVKPRTPNTEYLVLFTFIYMVAALAVFLIVLKKAK